MFNYCIGLRKPDKEKIPFNLQLFAEGASDGGAGVSAENIGAADKAEDNGAEEKKVIYGKVPENNENTVEGNEPKEQPEHREESFEELISDTGKYKEDFNRAVKSILDRRFPKIHEMKNTIAEQGEVLEELYDRFGVSDSKSLLDAIGDNENYLEELADRNGMSSQSYKEYARAMRENAKLLKQIEANKTEQLRRQDAQRWANEAEQLKGEYPDFDIHTEMENEQFRSLLRNNVPMKAAYEVIHLDRLTSGVARAAAEDASRKTAEQIRSRSQRPKENIGAASPGIIVKSDPSKLSKSDLKAIRKRAAMGEQIMF